MSDLAKTRYEYRERHICVGGCLSSRRIVGLDDAILGQRGSASGLRVDVLLAWAIDGDLDGNLTAFDLLAIHLADSLLLQFLRAKRDESETTALARLTTSLELLHHVALDGTESDLGGSGIVSGEELLELKVKC